jgi:hypothetical protein
MASCTGAPFSERCRAWRRQEVQQHRDVGVATLDAPGQGRDGVAGLVELQPVAVQQPVHLLDQRNAFARKAAPAQAFGIEAVHRQRVAARPVMKGGTSCETWLWKARHHVRADMAELVHARQATDDRPVAHVHVAGQRGVVGQDGVVPSCTSCATCT